MKSYDGVILHNTHTHTQNNNKTMKLHLVYDDAISNTRSSRTLTHLEWKSRSPSLVRCWEREDCVIDPTTTKL